MILTRGFGNGTFSGTIPLVVTRGYSIGVIASIWSKTTAVTTSWAKTAAQSTTWTKVT